MGNLSVKGGTYPSRISFKDILQGYPSWISYDILTYPDLSFNLLHLSRLIFCDQYLSIIDILCRYPFNYPKELIL